MSRTPKYTPETKVKVCELYLEGDLSMQEICSLYNIPYNYKSHKCTIYDWLYIYKHSGRSGFFHPKGNNSYSKEFKMQVVEESLVENDSLPNIAAKYKISSCETLRQWILKYNVNRELKDYNPKREVYMAEARRKTTLDGRREIVKYCVTHNRDYKSTASKYDVSYSQVYSWVRKYDDLGEESLVDKRGHHKTDDEVDELERLRRENLRLKRKLQESEMANQLLKKVKEFERM